MSEPTASSTEFVTSAAGFLASTEFFRVLPEAELRAVAAAFEPVHLSAGELLIRQGEPGDSLYVVQ